MRLHPALPAPPTSPAPVSARRLALLLAAALSAPWAASSLLRAADTIPAPAGLDRRLDAGARTAPSGPPLAFPDREGGALVIWAAPEGLFAARVRPAPAPGGPEDPVLIPGSGSLLSGSLHAVEDGAGGAILTWLRDSTGPETSLEIVRVDANGGVVGRTALPVFGEPAGIPVADGLGGLLVVYRGAGEPALTLTRFDSSLQEAWSAGGFAPHEVRVAFVTTDRVGGAFALWLAQGANGAAPSLRGQYFDEFGWTAWPEAGVEVATAGAGPADARNVSAVADHDGGLFVAWTGAAGFMVRHLDRDGIVQTPRSAGAYGGFAEGQATAGDAPPAGFLIAATDTRDLLYSMLVPRNDSGFELVAGRLSAGPSESASPPPLAAPLELAAPLQLAARLPGGSRLAALVPDGSGGGSVFWISPRESGRELLTRRWLPSGELIGPDGGQVIAASLPGSSGAPDRGFALALDDRARGVLAWAPAASGAFARPFVAPSVAQIKDVDIGNFFFSPANVDIVAGDTVQWHFVNGSHTTTSGGCSGSSCPPSGIWGSPVKTGGSFSFTFTTAGSFDYHCAVHGASMQGNVTVTGSLPLSCDATATPASGESELTVGFNSNISGGTPPYTIAWTFNDDGATSTAAAPTHTFVPAGDYLASLALSDSDGTACSDAVLVSVTPCVGRSVTSVTVTAKKKVKVKLFGSGFQSGDRLQIDAGSGFVDVPGGKVKSTKITAKDTAAVFPAGIPVQFRVLQANNCASGSLPAQR